MSAESIARWNAIPLSPEFTGSKRPRPEDDSDDDVSIVSRTPSPEPMNVEGDISEYDNHVPGVAREVITIDTKIKSSNKGFLLLEKLGWVEGQPLGISGDGRVDPIPFQMKNDLTGLGKTNQDFRMIETTVSQRRELDSERQQKETEDQRRAREDLVARKTALESEISSTLKAFYCTLCDKQFKTVAQYDEHTNSYAHHHKARFKDMQANIRIKPQEEIDKRKEKERKREEKELRKIAAANGIKMVKTTSISSTAVSGVEPQPLSSTKKAGWASVALQSSAQQRTSGWVTIGPTPPPPTDIPLPLPPPDDPRPPSAFSHAPAFRNAGWASLDESVKQSPPPPPPSSEPPVAASAPGQPSRGGWQTISSSHLSFQPPGSPALPSAPHRFGRNTPSAPDIAPPAPPSQSAWKQFQKSAGRRK